MSINVKLSRLWMATLLMSILIWVSVLGFIMNEYASMELTHQNQEQETWKKRKLVCTQKSVWKDSCQWVQKKVLRTKKDKSGKFGRVLGDFVIYDGQEDRNMGIVEYMIKHNIGVEYTGQSKQQIQEHHLQNRQYLKAQGFID